MRERYRGSAKEICHALLDHAVKQDDRLRQNGDTDLINDKPCLPSNELKSPGLATYVSLPEAFCGFPKELSPFIILDIEYIYINIHGIDIKKRLPWAS